MSETETTARQLELGRVGNSVPRVDGIPKTTGEFAYSSDLNVAGMLWVVVVVGDRLGGSAASERP